VNDCLIGATEQAGLVRGLEEKIKFLEQHYEAEIGQVRESYEIKLKSQLEP
jgi:hypothetical protein